MELRGTGPRGRGGCRWGISLHLLPVPELVVSTSRCPVLRLGLRPGVRAGSSTAGAAPGVGGSAWKRGGHAVLPRSSHARLHAGQEPPLRGLGAAVSVGGRASG